MSLTPSVNTIQGNDVSVPLFGSISFHERHVTYNATLLDWKEHTQAAATPFTRQKNTNLITLESLFLYNIIMRKWIPRLGCARSVDKVTKAHSFQILFGDNQFSQVKRIQNTHTRLASATHFTHWPFFFSSRFFWVS